MDKHDSFLTATWKVTVAWAGGILGMKLSDWVLAATLIYTVMQAIVLLPKLIDTVKAWRQR